MRKSEYARHRGVSKPRISELVKAGRIVLTQAGLVDVVASDAALDANRDPSRGGTGGAPWVAPATQHREPQPTTRAASAAAVGPKTLTEATTEDRMAAAELKRLRLRIEAGELCETAKMMPAIQAAFAQARMAWERAAPRVAAQVARDESDIRRCLDIIEREQEFALRDLAAVLDALADQLAATKQ